MSHMPFTWTFNQYKLGMQSSGLIVEPSEAIRFESVRCGRRYVQTFVLRNTTDSSQRIRIQPPKRDCFTLKYTPGPAVAPGLEIRGEIECLIADDAPDFLFTETITASMGAYLANIYIHASKVCAQIVFDDIINLGSAIDSSSELLKEMSFENKGTVLQLVKKLDLTSRIFSYKAVRCVANKMKLDIVIAPIKVSRIIL